MIQLYKNIKERRVQIGMSQDELAKKTGYTSRSSIAKIEKGEVDLQQSKIELFAKALGVSQPELMGWEENATVENAELLAEIAMDFELLGYAEKGDKYVSVSDCECYADNSACEQQYIGNSDFVNTNLSPGKNVSFTTYYEVPKDAKKVILEYSASFWTDKKITINLK